jgi:hypothetical protein
MMHPVSRSRAKFAAWRSAARQTLLFQVATIGLAFWSLPLPVSAQDCPVTCVTGSGPPYEVCTANPSGDYAFEGQCTPPFTTTAHVRYELVLGTFFGDAFGCLEGGSSAGLQAMDRYRVVGPATTIPIAFTANLDMQGLVEGDQQYLFQVGSGMPEYTNLPQPLPQTAIATIALQYLPGEEFVLQWGFKFIGNNFAFATVDGTLSFAGLPAGYAVRSCQGYTSDTIGIAPITWGAVKTLFRN